MKFAALWTMLMAVAIALYGAVVFAWAFGAGAIAWLLALPGMFVGLQLLGLLLVILAEFAEHCGFVRASWRATIHEWMLVAVLLWIGVRILPSSAMVCAVSFFAVMCLIRLLFHRCWKPGEPVEITQ